LKSYNAGSLSDQEKAVELAERRAKKKELLMNLSKD
jgi:hypothetical protein